MLRSSTVAIFPSPEFCDVIVGLTSCNKFLFIVPFSRVVKRPLLAFVADGEVNDKIGQNYGNQSFLLIIQ